MQLTSLTISGIFLFLILFGVMAGLLRSLHSSWWNWKPVRTAFTIGLILAIAAVISWATGYHYGVSTLTRVGSFLTPAMLIIVVGLVGSLPFSGGVNALARLSSTFKRRSRRDNMSPRRRQILKYAAGVFPAAALTSSVTGLADSYSEVRVPIRKVPVKELPESLQGFKIAQLSDSHLGYYVNLDHLERAVESVRPHNPDLVLVTGDVSDDLDVLLEALRIMGTLTPRYGIYACVGNHEYYKGIAKVLRIFEKGPIPILINDRAIIQVDGTSIFLGGADDPRTLREDHSEFLAGTIETTMREAPADSFRLLLCHRPEGFEYASTKGINLVLSGHTHGGQLGYDGRSLFEPVFPRKYLWGIYRQNNTTLHTSAGIGHWFPFRLGVPPEAPILVLEKG